MPLMWNEWERGLDVAAKKAEQDHDVIKCAKCKCTYFEQVKATQYLFNHSVIVGQEVPSKQSETPFVLLRCIKCQELTEPRLIRHARDHASKQYDNFLNEIEGEPEKL